MLGIYAILHRKDAFAIFEAFWMSFDGQSFAILVGFQTFQPSKDSKTASALYRHVS